MYYTLKKFSIFFWICAFLALGVAVYVLKEGLFSGRDSWVIYYILFMIPVVFSSIAVVLHLIQKSLTDQSISAMKMLSDSNKGNSKENT